MVFDAMSKAVLIYQDKGLLSNNAIIEMKIWQLPDKTKERPHGLKYSLFYGEDGKRVIGYDNERGKGDHRHYGDREEEYMFVSVDSLIDDFLQDVTNHRSKE
jgi:Family of unknown function (DUF6516)